MKTIRGFLCLLTVAMMGVGHLLMAQDGEVAPPAPDPVVTEPVAAAPAAEAEAGDDLISLSVTEAPIQDVLRSLASMRQGMNIIIDPDVTGKVSFKLEDVSWEVALQLITEANGLVATRQGDNIYRVHKPTVAPREDIAVVLFTIADVASMTDEQLQALVQRVDLSPAGARELVASAPHMYVKEITVNNRPAIDVVHALAQQSGLNFAFSADFGDAQMDATATAADASKPAGLPRELPSISLSLRNISVEQAMKLAAEQGGLSCINKNGVWVVSRLTPQQLQVAPLRMETFQVNFIPLDDELVKLVQTLLTERGKVSRGKNKILIVKDTEEALELVTRALLVMDIPTPQVLIEARFFQLNEDAEKRAGVDWGDLGDEDGANFKVSTSSLVYDYGDSGKFIDASENASLDGFNPLKAKTAILDLPDFELVLHALLSDSGAKQLANPKIVVSSDEQASIHIGEQKPIIRSEIETTEAGTVLTYELDPDYGDQTVSEPILAATGEVVGATRSYTSNKGYLDLGTRLTVLPSVKTEEEVYIKVVPELMSLIEDLEFNTGQGTTISFPRLFRTYVRTQFTVRSGQTIAIGGLVSENTVNETSQVPVLGTIPYLGRMFRYDRDVTKRSETIIFLTVKVIAGKELTTTNAIPIRALGVHEEVDRILEEDAAGAEYNQQRVKELVRELEKTSEPSKIMELKTKIRNLLRLPPPPPDLSVEAGELPVEVAPVDGVPVTEVEPAS